MSDKTTWNPAQKLLLPLLAAARTEMDVAAMEAALGALARLELLTWSEPDADGNYRAGEFIVCPRGDGTWRAYCVMVKLSPPVATPESAKLACERHARKMLGWEA